MGAPQYEQAGADIGGSGTTNTIPRWTGASTLGDSVITQNSTALVTTGSSSATQTTFRVRTVGTANNAPVFSLYREGVNEQVIWAGSGTIRFGFATDPAGYTDAQLLAATKMGIDASGNVGIGTASPASRLDVAGTITCDDAGTGLKLPATPGNADTQTLDCYQDGGASAGGLSWTPTLSAAATWGGTAPTVTNARYTRIGNLVFCTVTLDATGAVAFSSTYGSSTISSPAGLSATASTTVPSNRAGVSANGAQGGTTVYVPTYASNTTVINLTWFFAV